MDSYIQRFIFEELDIRGAVVRLGKAWQEMLAGRDYAAPVARLLGEMTAVTTVIAGNLKHDARLGLQLQGEGPVTLLVVECDQKLRLRGMAQADPDAALGIEAAGASELLGHGNLVLNLHYSDARQPYQSLVPLTGDGIAGIFEHYLSQSEQQPARLFLAADEENAVALFLQRMPGAEEKDADGWTRIEHLASTVRREELLELDAEPLLRRLFHEETLRLFPAQAAAYHCPENWDKVRATLLGLGREELDALLAEEGDIVIRDEICNREYRFSVEDVNALFAASGTARPTLH